MSHTQLVGISLTFTLSSTADKVGGTPIPVSYTPYNFPMCNVFKINTEEWIVRALFSEPIRTETAAKHGLRPSHLQALMALYSLTQREMTPVAPGRLYARTPTSQTLLRSYVRVLVLKGFVQRSRDTTGRARLSLTVEGKLLINEHARQLKRAVECYLAA